MAEPHNETVHLYKTAAALIALLALTVGLAYIDMGPMNLVVALLIAAVKAVLVVFIFMEVRIGSRLIWIMAGAGLLWLALLLGGTLTDVATRSMIELPSGTSGSVLTTPNLLTQSNPANTQNAGNIGPAGGWTKPDIQSTDKSGTPGEPINE